MTFLAEILITALLVISGFFGLVGSVGLVKLPEPMTRLHAPTKATTLGVGGVLIASMIYWFTFGEKFSFHELMITIFLFITAPIVAHFLAKAWLHRNAKPADLPPTGRDVGWAGQEGPEAGQAEVAEERREGKA
jgi:multicomponent K+:H+ antiporter subunit G